MFLKKIHLQNFKGLEDIELSFETLQADNRKWTLILGENGTGKSNLLKAIANGRKCGCSKCQNRI
jgi:AAA15 family ATPase/GTPase